MGLIESKADGKQFGSIYWDSDSKLEKRLNNSFSHTKNLSYESIQPIINYQLKDSWKILKWR